MAIESIPKAGKAVQGDHQNLHIQGAVWGKEDRCPKLVRELFNCSGHSALSGLVFKNDCSPFLMPPVSQMKLMPRSFQRPCHQGEMEVVSGNGKPLPYYIVRKAQGQFFSNICQIKIIPYQKIVILGFAVGSQTKNLSLGSSNKNVIVLMIKINLKKIKNRAKS